MWVNLGKLAHTELASFTSALPDRVSYRILSWEEGGGDVVFNGEGGYSVKVLKEVIKTVAREQCSAHVCLCLALRLLLSVFSIFAPFKDSVQTMSL